MSTSSRFSASGIAPTPLVLESPPTIDLSCSRQQMDLARSRQHSPHPLPQVIDGDGTMEADKQNEGFGCGDGDGR